MVPKAVDPCQKKQSGFVGLLLVKQPKCFVSGWAMYARKGSDAVMKLRWECSLLVDTSNGGYPGKERVVVECSQCYHTERSARVSIAARYVCMLRQRDITSVATQPTLQEPSLHGDMLRKLT